MEHTWTKGRQNDSGYFKKLLFKTSFMDCYLLKFEEGSFIQPHIDPVSDKEHHRLNIILKKAKDGGEFVCDNIVINKRFIYFRPDMSEHSVKRVNKGKRYVFSIGWAKKPKKP